MPQPHFPPLLLPREGRGEGRGGCDVTGVCADVRHLCLVATRGAEGLGRFASRVRSTKAFLPGKREKGRERGRERGRRGRRGRRERRERRGRRERRERRREGGL